MATKKTVKKPKKETNIWRTRDNALLVVIAIMAVIIMVLACYRFV